MALTEICAGSINSAMAAFSGGADRLELCDNLYEGGTTPSLGYLKTARQNISIPINVLIRPRGGDFLYNKLEFNLMMHDIAACKDIGMNGVVIGILNENGTIDERRTSELIELARPMTVTFHRAFDMVPKPEEALECLISMGVDRVLTSGQKITAPKGIELIKQLILLAGNDIIILPGGGLNVGNIGEFASVVAAKEYHATCRSEVKSRMFHRNDEVTMGGLAQIPEYDILETDTGKVSSFVKILSDY